MAHNRKQSVGTAAALFGDTPSSDFFSSFSQPQSQNESAQSVAGSGRQFSQHPAPAVQSTDAADLFASSDVTGTDSLWGQNVTADATHQWLTQQEGHQNAAEQQDIPTGNYEYAGQDTHLPTTVEDPYASQGWYDEHGQWHEYQDSTHQEQNWVQSSEYDVSGGENSAYAPTAYDYGYPNHNAPSQSVSSTTSPTYPETSTTGYSSGGSYASQEPYDPYQPASSSYLPHPNPTTMVTSPSGHTTVATTPNSTPAPARKVASSNTVYASPAAYDPYKPTATSYSAPPAKPAPPATGPSISSTPYQTQSSLGSKPTQNASSAYRSTSYNAYDPPIPNRARKTARSPSLTSPPPSASYYGYGATPVEAVFSKPITSSPQPPPPPSHHQPPPAPPVHNGRQPPLALQNYGSPESVYNPYSPPVQNVVSPPPNGAYPASAYGANPVPIAAPPSSGYGHGIIDAADAAQAHSWAHDKPLSNGSGQYESGWYRDDHSQGQQPVMQQIDLQEPSYDPEGAETPHYDPYRDEGAQHAVGNVVPETEGTTHASFAASMSMTVMPTVVPNNAYAPPVGPYVPGRKDSVLSISSHGSRPSSRAGPPPASKAQTSPSVSTKTANSVNGSLPASPQHSSPSLSSPPPAHQYPAKPPPRTGTPGSIRARVASPDMHPSMVAAASRKSPRPDSYPGSNASSVSSPAAHLEAARSRIASPEVGVKLPPPVKPNANGAIAPYDPYKPARTASLSVSETGRSVDSAIPRSASPYSMSTTEDHHASPYDPYAPRQHTRKQTSESMDYGIEYTSRYDVAQPASQSPPYVPYASTPTPAEPPYPVRTSIESVYAPSLTQTGGDDILRRADCSTRCPILTFGFGGKVVSFFPNQMDATTGFDVSLISRKPAPVTIRQLKDIMEDNRTYPGPLFSDPGTPTVNITRTAAATVKAKKGLVVKYLEERSEEVERGLAHLEPLDRSKAAGRLCLIQLLKVMIENDGKISGTPEIEKAVRGILVPRLKDSPDSSASYAFTTPATNSMLAPGDPMHPAGLAHGDATVATYTVRSGALDKIQDYLLRGEKRIAYRHALDERLWAHAMLIASSLDKEAWKEVVTEFIRTELGVDPSRVAADPVNGREALRVTYGMFAGLGYGSVQELLPPKPLTRSSGAANPMLIAPSPMTIPSPALGSAIPQPTKLAFTGDAPVAILAKWQETAAAILSNATNGDAVAMTALGDFLMTNKWVDAAHVCYLLSPHTSLLGGFGSTAAKVVLVGSENPQNRSTFHTDVDPLIFSEILEFALSLAPSPKGQDAFTGVPHLQAYRLIHAFQLAELGYISVASRYCEAIASALRLSKASQYYTPTFQEQLKDLSDRLSGTPQLDKTGSWIARKMTKPSLATIGTWIETGVTKFIAGEGEEGSIGSGNSETAKQDGSNAAAGPFSQYAVISSAQTSPNASSLNLAANSPTNGLAPPPASHKALRRSGSALAVRAQPSSLTPIDRAASAMDMRPDPRSPYGGGPQIFSANAATTSFYPSTPSYSQSEATDETVTGDSEKPSSGNWWDSSTSLDDGSKTTPTATFYSIGSTSEETGDFVSPMDTPLPPASRAASYSSTSRSTSVAPVEEEDEDDLGLGNNSSKKKRTPPAKTEDSEETKPAPNGDAAKPAPAPANPPTTPKPASNPESRSSGSWLPWRWGKKEEAAPTGGPVRAKLGEENSFYYDKELKRWVNKKAGGDATPAAAPLPPPPSRVPSRAQTTSPSTAAPPATLPRGVTPPPRPQSSISAMATNGKTLQPKRSHLAESYTPSSEPLSAPPTMATAPPPFSRIADPDLVPPPLSARSSAAAKRKGKSRYVDVFQQEQAS